MRSPLANAIREARLAVRLTQEELGRQIGLKGRAVYRWERDASVPRRFVRGSVVRAIAMRNPEVAARLATAFETHAKRKSGFVAPEPAPAPPPPPLDPVALEFALFAMADELDLAPRRLRASLTRLFPRVAQAGYSLDSARHAFEARSGSAQPYEPKGD